METTYVNEYDTVPYQFKHTFNSDEKKKIETITGLKELIFRLIENNIKSMNQFVKFDLPNNIPTSPNQYYKEWTSWGDFFGTCRIQDNLLSIYYLSYNEAKEYIKNNLSEIKTRKIWKDYVKCKKIPKILPNHPELFYNRKNRGWIGWKNFLSK